MDEMCYLISDASKKVDVETHVLRYWEEELGLAIPRNEMGHRYYTEFHIRLFCQVKKLKDRGYQLKAIKNALQQIMVQNQGITETASLLENDIAKTLQENQRFRFTCRFSSDKLHEGEDQEKDSCRIARLADYNRLELKNSTATMKIEKPGQSSWSGQSGQKEKPTVAIDSEKNGEIIQEKEEKDGQADMKNKGKNRKKPSAWERRNGMVANRKIVEDGEAGNKESEERLAEEETAIKNEVMAAENRMVEEEELTAEDKTAVEDETQVTTVSLRDEVKEVPSGVITSEEKMMQFQEIMNHVIGRALEVNSEKLSQDISRRVNETIAEELEYQMQLRDEREESRYRQLDEIIRSCQRENQGRAEAAATKVSFFKRKHFGQNGNRT